MPSVRAYNATTGIFASSNIPFDMETRYNFPGRNRTKDGLVFFEITRANVEYLIYRYRDKEITWDESIDKYRQGIMALIEKEDQAIARKNSELADISEQILDFPYKKPPYRHQMKGLELSWNRSCFGWFMDMGTGKTKLAIDNIALLYKNKAINTALIIAPNNVHIQWINEQIPDHMTETLEVGVDYKAEYFVSSPNTFRRNKLKKLMEFPGLRIVAVNIESLSSLKGFQFCTEFLENRRSLIIVDESSRIKNSSAKRTKNVLKLAPLSAYRRILTGTPITQGLEDMYSQFSFLSKTILGYSSFYTFRNHFCVTEPRFNRITGYRNIEQFQRLIEAYTYRVTKEECLDLPEKTFMNVPVPLTEEQADLYRTLEQELILQLKNNQIPVTLAIVRLLRLQQIVCGHLPEEQDESVDTTGVENSEDVYFTSQIKKLRRIDSNRVSVTVECLRQITGKVIIWARFIDDVHRLSEELQKEGIGSLIYRGDSQNREKVIARFRDDPSKKVFLANPATAGIGLNLAFAEAAIWYSATFSLEQYLQANDRIHRIGQTKNVLYIHLYAPSTVDKKIWRAIKAKKSFSDSILSIRNLLEEKDEEDE